MTLPYRLLPTQQFPLPAFLGKLNKARLNLYYIFNKILVSL